jgi:hypothetical protein
MPKESVLVSKIIKTVKKMCGSRVWIRKISDRYTRGLPDLVMVANCWWPSSNANVCAVFFIECKTKDGKLSKLQSQELKSLSSVADGDFVRVIVATSVDDIVKELVALGFEE